MSGPVLLTGATGFLGREVLSRLVEEQQREVIVLIRARDEEEAAARLEASIARLYEVRPDAYELVRALPYDLAAENLGLAADHRAEILHRTQAVVHCAASIRFDLPLEEAVATNVLGTERVLDLAAQIERRGSLEQVVHVSTAYVAGSHEGTFRESDGDLGQRFRNTYEQSKLLAEQRVRARELPAVIARPSIVVGERGSGWTPSFNVVYWPLQAFARGLIRELPANPAGVVDIVPIDYVAAAIACLSEETGLRGTMQLVAGDRASCVAELVELACGWFGRPAPEVVEPGGEDQDAFMPYFDVRTRFDDSAARAYLEPNGLATPELAAYFPSLIAYARESRWGKRPLTREAARELAAYRVN